MAAIPPVSALTETETFEDDTVGLPPTGAFYTATAGSAADLFTTNTQAVEGTKSASITGTTAPLPRFVLNDSICDGITVSFAARFPSIADSPRIGIGTTGGNSVAATRPNFHFVISGAGVVSAAANSDTTTASGTFPIPITITANTWHNYTLSVSSCALNEEAFFTIDDSTTFITIPAGGFANPGNIREVKTGRAADGGGVAVFIDNLVVTTETDPIANTFCPDPFLNEGTNSPDGDHPDYGYNYRQGGEYFDQSEGDVPGIGLSTGFEYTALDTLNDWDISAKGYTTGSKAFHENLTIEADDTGGTTTFRVNFNLNTGASPTTAALGNGLTTGNFASHVEAQMVESGNDWAFTFWYVNAGARTNLGSTAFFGTPNDAEDYTFWIDTRGSATGPPDSTFGPSGGSIITGPYIAVTTPTTSGTESNRIVKYQTLTTISGNPFLEDTVFDVWNIASGGAILGSRTALDENIQTGDNTDDEGGYASTCIFDDIGTAVPLGSFGSDPFFPDEEEEGGGDDCQSAFCVPEGVGGLSSEALSLFLGIVLVAAFAASMNERTGAGAAGLAIFALLGLFVAYALGFIDLWVIVSLTIMGVATIFLGVINGRSASGGF